MNTPILFPIKKISERNFDDNLSLSLSLPHKYSPSAIRVLLISKPSSWIKGSKEGNNSRGIGGAH